MAEAGIARSAIDDDDDRFRKLAADVLVLKWMVGAILAGVVSLVTKTFM